YHAFQATVRRVRGSLTAGLSYTYSHSIDTASDRSDPVLVNSYDLAENKASSNFDIRHLLTINYVYRLPNFARLIHDAAIGSVTPDPAASNTPSTAPSPSCCKIMDKILGGWEISGVTLFQSGTPFTVINSAGNTGISLTDNAGVSSGLGIAESYPDVLRGPSKSYSNAQSFGPLLGNPSQFVAPRGLTFGNAGRNFLN